MRHILFAIHAGLLALGLSLVGCMAGHGVGPAPAGGVSLGGDGVYSASAPKTDSPTADATTPSSTSAAGPVVAAAGSTDAGSSSGSHPAFGPDVMAPMSDSETTGGGKPFARAALPGSQWTVDSLPKALDFRLITGFKNPNVQVPDEPMPSSLNAVPQYVEALSSVGPGIFLVQAQLNIKPDKSEGLYWYDVIGGPTVRMVVQRDGQDLVSAPYIDLPVAYFGLKEFKKGSNLDAEFPLILPFWAGDTVSFYLYYDLKKPIGYNDDPSKFCGFATPADANTFYGDKEHVHFLGSFPVTLEAIARAPEPSTKPDDKPQYVVSPAAHVSVPTVWAAYVKHVFYTKIDYVDPSGRTATGSDFSGYGTPLPLPSDPKAAPGNLLFTAQYATLDTCGGSECWPWKPIDDGHFVRMLVERQAGYDSVRLDQDIKLTADGGMGNLSISLSPDVPLKDGDILDFYYYRPGGKPTASYSPELTEIKKNADGSYDDAFFEKALFMGRFQVKIGMKVQKIDGFRPPDVPLVPLK